MILKLKSGEYRIYSRKKTRAGNTGIQTLRIEEEKYIFW